MSIEAGRESTVAEGVGLLLCFDTCWTAPAHLA
jgi:hypothetical protein